MNMQNYPIDFSALAKAQKENVLRVREEFFDSLLSEWSRPPANIDILMRQDDSYISPDYASDLKDDDATVYIKDIEKGLLAASVTPPKTSSSLRWVYSILQAGDWLRYGLLIQGDPKLVLKYERHHDNILGVEKIWDRPCEYQFRDSGGLLLEWRFEEPDFYTNFSCRERFIIIARHLHLRVGKILQSVNEGEGYNLDDVNDSDSSWDNNQIRD